jgi:hypothetical protein
MFHAGGRAGGRAAETTQLIVAFRNFENAPKNSCNTNWIGLTVAMDSVMTNRIQIARPVIIQSLVEGYIHACVRAQISEDNTGL